MNLIKRKRSLPEKSKLRAQYDESKHEYDAVLRSFYRRTKNLLIKNDINATIKFRTKSFESYYDKLHRLYNSEISHIQITDMIGLRIICPFLEDLDTIEKLITANFDVCEIERKGADQSFKEFSYNSIHILVEPPKNSFKNPGQYVSGVCEIQIRTILQEAWAEVEHELIYKADFSLLNEPAKRKLASLNATLTLSDIIFQEIRDFQKEIKERGRKRRERLQEKAQMIDTISILDTEKGPRLELPDSEDEKPVTIKPRDEMERLIFEALDTHSSGNCEGAIKIYTKILKLKPEGNVKSVIYNHRGMAHFVMSNYKKAVNDFTKAIESNPDNFRAYNHRGLSQRMLKNFDLALLDFSKSIEINDMQIDGYYSRALTFFDLRNFPGAIEDCENVLKIKPDFSAAQQLKALIDSRVFSQPR